jgi:hypothetical protein
MAKDKVLRERDVERYLVEQVQKAGGEVRKQIWPGHVHAPDRLIMLPSIPNIEDHGFTYLAEVKRPGGKPRPGQLREHARLRKIGQRVVVIDSFEAVDELLRGWL